MAAADAEIPQAALTLKPGAFEQARRARVIYPYECLDAIDGMLVERPLEDGGYGFAHQALAPVSSRKVIRQLGPAMCD